MDENEIKQKLNELADMNAAKDAVALEKQAIIETILTPEIKEKIAEIEAEFSGRLETVNEKAAALETEIRAAVVANGATVKGDYLQAVYAKGRVTWDNKTLEGLMIAIPQLEKARKIGEPSVSLRKV